jgi:hypothetical protein
MRTTRRGSPSPLSIPLFPVLTPLLATIGSLALLLLLVSRHALLSARSSTSSATLPRSRSAPSLDQTPPTDIRPPLLAEEPQLLKRLTELREQLSSHRAQLRRAKHQREILLWKRIRLEQEALHRSKAAPANSALDQAAVHCPDELSPTPTRWEVLIAPSPHGEQRSPVVLECEATQVVLQPYAVAFVPEDFQSRSPGTSVFATAISAVIAFLREEAERKRTPPPCLAILVRPEGIPAFYTVVRELEAAGREFGYELIDRKLELHFPPADPISIAKVASLVQEARALAAARGAEKALSSPLQAGDQQPLERLPAGASGPEVLELPTARFASGSAQSAPLPKSFQPPKSSTSEAQPTASPSERPRLPSSPILYASAPDSTAATNRGLAPVASPLSPTLPLAPKKPVPWRRPVAAVLAKGRLWLLPDGQLVSTPPTTPTAEATLLWILQTYGRPSESELFFLEWAPELHCFVAPEDWSAYWKLKFVLAGLEVTTVGHFVGAEETLLLQALTDRWQRLPLGEVALILQEPRAGSP